jgi:hypothetical protein
MNIETISAQVKKVKYNMKDNSIKIIVSNFLNIARALKFSDVKSFENIDLVKKYLDIKFSNFQTKSNYYKSIRTILISYDYSQEILKKYDIVINEFNKQYNNINASGAFISKKQEDAFITEKEFKNFMNDFKIEILKEDLLNKCYDCSSAEFRKLQMYVILNIYLKFPLRADIGDLIYINKRELNKISKETQKNNNYLLFFKNKYSIILNKYKTDILGQKIIEINDRVLTPILKKYIDIVGKGYLFKNNKEEPFSPNLLSQTIIRFFEKRLNKRVSINILRKAYLTDKYENNQTIKDMKKDSYIMGHSLATQNKIYVKKTE